MTGLTITGGSVLDSANSTFVATDLHAAEGLVAGSAVPEARSLDATGCLVLPGIVDIHGDAFERAVMPRGGVMVDVGTALADNDAHLLAAGITTAYLSFTDSWEPGLRSRDVLRAALAALANSASGPERLVHVRHECCNTDNFDELLGWISSGQVTMISYNDHTPGGILHTRRISPKRADRAGVTVEEFTALQDAAVERRPQGSQNQARLAEVCRTAGCPTASHDAGSDEDFSRDLNLGVAIAEFPFTITLAQRYLEAGVDVLLGAPNLVRGGSHLGNLSVRDAIAANAATLLCSDYHYPSLLRAPFVVAQQGLMELADAWSMVSAAPARAAGLADRGTLAPGQRADVIVVEYREPDSRDEPVAPHVRAVVVDGAVVYEARRR